MWVAKEGSGTCGGARSWFPDERRAKHVRFPLNNSIARKAITMAKCENSP